MNMGEKKPCDATSADDCYIHLPPFDLAAALGFLRYLREDDDAEAQRDTFAYLQQAMPEVFQ